MSLALLQPHFAPDLHDLAMMLRAGRVVLQDLDPWSRKGRVHRAQIRTPEGITWVHIPVLKEETEMPIYKVRIDQSRDWAAPLMRSLEFNYRNSLYFDFYEPELWELLRQGREEEFLLPLNRRFRRFLFRYLELERDLKSKISFASEQLTASGDPKLSGPVQPEPEEDVVWQEHDSRNYMRPSEQRTDFTFTHPEYRQHFDGFSPGCSLLDLLFQYGPESFRITDRLIDSSPLQ